MSYSGNYRFEDALGASFDRLKQEICCVKIGKIETFYPETKTADVLIPFKQKRPDGELIDNVLILGALVMGNTITLPIRTGEYCIVLFNDFDYDLWYNTGHDGEPETDRTHNITDAIVITGLNGLFNAIQNYDNEHIALNFNSKVNGTLDVTDDTTIEGDTTFRQNIVVNVNVTVNGDMDIDGKITLNNKSAGQPNCFCSLPSCLFSGAVHTTNTTE
ncbi:hypothetical protein FACS1894152_5580 [Bacilli bacterium]|nr:hypothetical protein FACS1894152_5580 [Bacilli bacterium]